MKKSDVKNLTVIPNKEFHFKKVQPRNRLTDENSVCEYCPKGAGKAHGTAHVTCGKPAFAQRFKVNRMKNFCEEHYMQLVQLAKIRDARNNVKNKEKRDIQKATNNAKRSQRSSKKEWAAKINSRCSDILEGIEPKLIKTGIREEFYRYSFYDLLMDNCVPFINEYELGKEIGVKRTLVLEDTYIPSLDLLISFKRNSVTNYQSFYDEQFYENKRLLAIKHPRADLVSTDIDGSSCCMFNSLRFYEFIRNRALRYSKRKTAIIKYKINPFIESLDERIKLLKTRSHLFVK